MRVIQKYHLIFSQQITTSHEVLINGQLKDLLHMTHFQDIYQAYGNHLSNDLLNLRVG